MKFGIRLQVELIGDAVAEVFENAEGPSATAEFDHLPSAGEMVALVRVFAEKVLGQMESDAYPDGKSETFFVNL